MTASFEAIVNIHYFIEPPHNLCKPHRAWVLLVLLPIGIAYSKMR